YFLIGVWGGPRRIYAALKFVLFTMAGSLLMLVAILYCAWRAPGTTSFAYETWLARLALSPREQLWLFAAFALAFAIKVPLFALHPTAVAGAVYQMLNHGLSTGGLFLLVGMIYERRHTRLIADFGGLWTAVPVYAAFFMVVMLASVGLPGLNGFVGEFLILLGSFGRWPWATAVATSGVVLGALYLLWMYERVIFGPLAHEENAKLEDLSAREVTVLLPVV